MTTEERLENLERELARAKRRNRWLVAVVGLVVVGLILAWTWNKTTATAQAAGGTEKVIGANMFVMADANGIYRAMLNMTNNEPGLTLLDENGKIGANLSGGGPAGPGLTMCDENGKIRVLLFVNKKVGPGLRLLDENGKTIWSAP